MPGFVLWVWVLILLLPFALNFALGVWGGRHVAPAAALIYCPLILSALTHISLHTGYQNTYVNPTLNVALLTIGTAFLGAWLGAARQRKQRFALIGAASSADEAALVLAKPRRVKMFSKSGAAWLLGLFTLGGGIFGFVKVRSDEVLHPKTPESAVRVMLYDAGMNWNDMKPATDVSTRLLPPEGAAEKAGRERRVWYRATMHAGDAYRARRIASLQRELRAAVKNPRGKIEARYLRASLARLKRDGYVLQRVVRVQNTPDGWHIIENRNGNAAPWAWLYDTYYEDAPEKS